MLTERFLHHIWFSRLFYEEQTTLCGQKVEVIDLGQPNTNAGADVFNAKIRIGDTLWAGNVEFHIRSSDWITHRHDRDHAYDSVILHVICENDFQPLRSDGSPVPQLILRYPNHIETEYGDRNIDFVHCYRDIENGALPIDKDSLQTLLFQRMQRRVEAIQHSLEANGNDWEEAFYQSTARSFGFGTNSEAFEQLARYLPQRILAKHKDDKKQIEALLFGVAGFLAENPKDDYHASLSKEFDYLAHKYELKPMDKSQWKFLRLRPMNFPTVRLAQFADLVYRSAKLFSKVVEQKSYRDIINYYSSEPSDYWLMHYNFGSNSKPRSKKISKSSIDVVIINSVVPFLYAYGEASGVEESRQRAICFLRKIPAEKNHITYGFEELGVKASNAFDSQALKELKVSYCQVKKCYICKNRFWKVSFSAK